MNADGLLLETMTSSNQNGTWGGGGLLAADVIICIEMSLF